MRRGSKIALGSGAVLVVGLTGALVKPTRPIAVEVATVEKGPVEERVSAAASGDVEPRARAVLRAETVGGVTKVLGKAGDRVEAGQLLLRLDDSALSAAAAAARLQAETAAREAGTAEQMRLKGVITEQALLQARDARDLARANLSLAEANLARATVKTPFAGLLARLPLQEGDGVVVGQTLAEVVEDSALYVRAAFDEVDAVKVKLNDPAVVRLDAYPDDPLPAVVDRMDPVVGGDTISGGSGAEAVAIAGKKDRTVGIRVQIDGKAAAERKQRLFVGMSADVEIILGRKPDTLRVPSAAIFHEKGKLYAYVLVKGRLRRRPVETGGSNWEFQEVLDGLSEGDRVLVSLDVEGVKDGARAVPRASPTPGPTSAAVR